MCSHCNVEDGRKHATFHNKALNNIMLYYFKNGKNATETQQRICAEYGEGAMIDRKCQNWFVKLTGTINILAK